MEKIFITGISGMIGSALSDLYTSLGYEVSGLSRSTSHSRLQNIKHYQGDILDKEFLKKTLFDYKPDVIFHLAAQAFNSQSWIAEATTYLTNIQGSRNVLEAVRNYCPDSRLVVAGSSAAYGHYNYLIPENRPLKPISPYGISKAVTEMMAYQSHQNYNLDVVTPRLFIHIGINHPPLTLVQNICKQVAEQIKDDVISVYVGNVDTVRDMVDIRDGVKALRLLAEKGVSGEVYNVCSGMGWSGRDIVEILSNIIGKPIGLEYNSKLTRPSDEKMLIGNPAKINKLGWEPRIEIEETLKWVLQNWIERLS